MPARLRVLYYNHTRKVSGGERMLLLMLRVLDRSLYEPLAACPLAGEGTLDQLLREQGIEPLQAPLLDARFTSNPLRLAAYLRSFASTILAFRGTLRNAAPDLIHANSVRAGIVATLATAGMKTTVLWHVQDDLPAHPISTPIRLLAYLSPRTHAVAVSSATARAFAGSLRFGPRLTVLHNAIDRTRFPRKRNPLRAAASSFRSELALKPDDILVAAVGMINPRKGLLPLVEAFAMVAAQNPAAHLAIVGAPIFNQDHLHEAQLHARAAELGLSSQIHFTGPRDDVPAVLRAADIFLLNAFVEPFGLVILEAMSSGTPVLAASVGGIPEIIADGVTGRLIPSPSLLAPLLAAAIRSPESLTPLAEAAYTTTLPRFSVEAFTANLHRLYASLA